MYLVARMIHQLNQLAVIHCHTFNCCKVVWNLFLEKDIGNSRIDWLHLIHLPEADFNLIFCNWFSSKGFLPKASCRKVAIFKANVNYKNSLTI